VQIHQIIRDENLLLKFIDWLPILEKDEVYFLCLQARKKYMPSLKAKDKTQLKRFVSTKERLFEKIRQLECAFGAYQTDDGDIITDNGIALYITTNPRDMRKATFASIKSLVGLIESNDQQRNLNPHSEVLSQIHKSKSRSAFLHFDIDIPVGDESDRNAAKCCLSIDEICQKTADIVGSKAFDVIITRGGYHVLLRPELVTSKIKNWYCALQSVLNCDQSGDLMVPVVGCCQGGFTPHFYACKTVNDTNIV